MDLVKIAAGAAAECVRQQVGLYEVSQLIKAYTHIVHYRDRSITLDESRFSVLGQVVEPVENRHGFRTTPVTFRDGGTSAPASEIPRLMGNLCEQINNVSRLDAPADITVDFLVREFLWIHPFADGNGRVGWLLYNYLRGTLDAPEPLPYYFGEK